MPRTHILAVGSLLFVSLTVCAPLQANGQSGGGRTSGQRGNQQGDVFSTNTRGGSGNTTKKTQTQGLNHGNGGNRTCQTTRNTPDYDPRTCTTSKPKCVLSSDVYEVYREIDDFWKKQFAARRLPYMSPYLADSRDSDELVRYAAYDRRVITIFVNLYDLKKATGIYGNQAMVAALAHEYGHHVQNQLRLEQDHKFSEQLADEMTGVFFRYLHDKGCVVSTSQDDDLARLERLMPFLADPRDMRPADVRAHGNAAERWFNFNSGYRNPGNTLRGLLPPVPQRRSSSTGRPD